MPILESIRDILDVNNANGLPLIIEEQDGLKAQVVLGSKARPQRGVEVGDKVRHTKVFYPGSDEATIHVQGMEYDDIILRGRFHDPIGDLAIGGSRRRVELLRGLQHRRAYCKLSWGGNIVRYGIVADVKFTEKTHHDINYEIRFVVSKAEETGAEANNTIQLTRRQAAIDATIRDVRRALNTILDIRTAAQATINFVSPAFRRGGRF